MDGSKTGLDYKMGLNIGNLIKKVGGGLLKSLPGGGLLVAALNAALPSGTDLPENATGDDLAAVVATLPPEQQVILMAKEFDVEIEAHHTLQAMLNSEQKTRPHIALGCFYVIALTTVMTVGAWVYAVIEDKAEMVKAIMNGWPFVVAITGTLSTVLLSYFGNLVKEGKNKMDAANGISQPSGIAGLIGSLLKK